MYFNIFHSLNFFSIHCTIFRLLEGREYVLFTFPHVTTMNIGMAEYCNVIVFLTAQYILLKRMYRGFMKRNSSWRCFPEKKKIKQIVIFFYDTNTYVRQENVMIYHGFFLHLAWDKNLLSHSSEISQKVLTGRQQGWLLEPHVRQILNVLEKSDSFSLFFSMCIFQPLKLVPSPHNFFIISSGKKNMKSFPPV